MPTEPLEPPVAIWELMPITRPWPSSSGPPELPGLIEASVWITLADREAVGRLDLALERRDDAGGDGAGEAERVADRDRRRRPPCTFDESPSGSGIELRVVGIDLQHRQVGGRVAPGHLGVHELARPRRSAPARRSAPSTTWALVMIVPSLVDHEARAGGGAALPLLGQAERRLLAGADAPRADEDHAAALVLVDVGHAARRRRRRSRRPAGSSRAVGHDLAGGVAGVDHVGGDQHGAEARARRGRRAGRRGSWTRERLEFGFMATVSRRPA